MANLIKIDKDGVLEGMPEGVIIRTHVADPDVPGRHVPKFEICKYRTGSCRLSDCGKRPLFIWNCSLFKMKVMPKDCATCQSRVL